MTLVSLEGIVKEFPGVLANDGVDFELAAGEVHALLGENGAGKTTLMNVLAGLVQPDDGRIVLNGEQVELRSPRDSIARGVGMVHQHFRLVERFTVAENVTLGWHTPAHVIRRRPLEREIARLSDSWGVKVLPSRPVWQLSVGEQQRVELLKNLYRNAAVLILDEPTAVLTPQEATGLFESLRQLARAGKGIVFISHKLDEVMAVADRVTVLRRGRNVATVAAADTNQKELARMMIGRDLALREPGPHALGDPMLELHGLEAEDDRGVRALRGVDLSVHGGEILGLAGVAGNGQRELAEVVVGLRPARAGRVVLGGRDITHWRVRRRISAGIGYTPEDRLRDGVAPVLSVADNLVAKQYRSLGLRERRRVADRLVASFGIVAAGLDVAVATLSGGNVQKLLLARELSAGPRVLIAVQPTRGLDLAAVESTQALLLELRESGRAVLLISEDLDELLTLADRIAIMYEGRIMDTFPAGAADEERIGLLMAGRTA